MALLDIFQLDAIRAKVFAAVDTRDFFGCLLILLTYY
jgi:hypothetical protein